MMLLGRWVVAGVLGAGILSVCLPAQTPRKPGKAHKAGATPTPAAASGTASEVVQPERGPLPEQAVEPDQSAPLAPVLVPDPPPPSEAELPHDPAPVAAEPVASPAAASVTAKQAAAPLVQPAAAEVAKVEEDPLPPNATPEQRQLRLDTDHLLQLVQELKAEVEKAGTNTLSLGALRKADEVQRLSKSLKERMRGWSQTAQNK
jgi:hypothetical protein